MGSHGCKGCSGRIIYIAEEEEENKAYRKHVFVEKKSHAKMMSRTRLEAEYSEALEEIGSLKRNGKKSMTYEETAKAYYYVLGDEEGEERVRKEIFRSDRREANTLYKEDFDRVIENRNKLIAEVLAYPPIIAKKRCAAARAEAQKIVAD